jgi:hypothetical protein
LKFGSLRRDGRAKLLWLNHQPAFNSSNTSAVGSVGAPSTLRLADAQRS